VALWPVFRCVGYLLEQIWEAKCSKSVYLSTKTGFRSFRINTDSGDLLVLVLGVFWYRLGLFSSPLRLLRVPWGIPGWLTRTSGGGTWCFQPFRVPLGFSKGPGMSTGAFGDTSLMAFGLKDEGGKGHLFYTTHCVRLLQRFILHSPLIVCACSAGQ
jgi:hypothetical protein